MVGWDLFKKAYSKFLGASDNSSISSIAGTLAIRSGIKHPSFNFFIVDNVSNNLQNNVFIDNFQCDGFIVSFTDSRNNVASWSDRIKFLGSGMLMTALSSNISTIPVDDSIVVKSIKDGKTVIDDHCSIIESVKNVNNYRPLIENNINDIYIYVAYVDGIAAGTVAAIRVKESIFILDTVTLEKYQNKGILSAIANASIKENNANTYSAIVTSEYSQKVAKSLGFKVEQVFDLWINKNAR